MAESYQRTVLVATGNSTPLIPASEKRRAIIITSPPTNRFTISFGQDAALDLGITLFPLTSPLILRDVDFGCCVKKAINAISAVADQNVTFVEVLSE